MIGTFLAVFLLAVVLASTLMFLIAIRADDTVR
jgi:hypothetical protein